MLEVFSDYVGKYCPSPMVEYPQTMVNTNVGLFWDPFSDLGIYRETWWVHFGIPLVIWGSTGRPPGIPWGFRLGFCQFWLSFGIPFGVTLGSFWLLFRDAEYQMMVWCIVFSDSWQKIVPVLNTV